MADAVLHGVTGFVVPPGDIERMAGAVGALLEDATLARECGRQARRLIEQEFDMVRNARALQEVLLEYAHPSTNFPDEAVRQRGVGAA
jgi:glycosyltransferase involved in cell wall biosynthesis